ncbi:SixA phosphatase family protein [Spartinivicinus poritis]|uniref:Histidine phosphatase family protein n=1 Tax=Spartinivicinus poritis TaxID=2994640 RepID=A0ABT5U457_9GAMM|nr:histidine phosphatase family protein [Spartinivicinus sp. A2-2]MDE1461151.1 histidine phosphatase family protein [Spartinivicinus sp. A2-2]
MKELLLVRHAKSSWKDDSLADFDRPLNKRGKKTAPLMGQLLADKHWQPDRVFASPAARTKATAELLLPALAIPPDQIDWYPSLYDASVKAIFNAIKQAPAACQRLMIIGHNPGIEETIEALDPKFSEMIPTCCVTRIRCNIKNWQEITKKCGEVMDCLKPKEVLVELI